MPQQRKFRKYIIGFGLLLLFATVITSQQAHAEPSIYFFSNYIFVSNNHAVQLTFQVEDVPPPNQIHVTVSLSKSPGMYWSENLDFYYQGYGMFNVIVPAKGATATFQHGYTYLATMYVFVTYNNAGSPSTYGRFAEYNIQP